MSAWCKRRRRSKARQGGLGTTLRRGQSLGIVVGRENFAMETVFAFVADAAYHESVNSDYHPAAFRGSWLHPTLSATRNLSLRVPAVPCLILSDSLQYLCVAPNHVKFRCRPQSWSVMGAGGSSHSYRSSRNRRSLSGGR